MERLSEFTNRVHIHTPLSLSLSLMEVGTSYKELLSSEGTALLHVDFALRQDQVLYTLLQCILVMYSNRCCLKNFGS